MKQFKDFGIRPELKSFKGDKIKIEKLLNVKIIVHDFKVENSKFNGQKKCLYLQISIQEKMHVTFIGSSSLIEMINKVPKKEFPFETTIVKEDMRLQFT